MADELLWINPSSFASQKIASAVCATFHQQLVGSMFSPCKDVLDLHTGFGRDYGSGHHYGGKLMDTQGKTSWFPSFGQKLTSPKSGLLWSKGSVKEKAKAVAKSISQAKPGQMAAHKGAKMMKKRTKEFEKFKHKSTLGKIGLGAATGATASAVFSMMDNFPYVMNGDMRKYCCVVLKDSLCGAAIGGCLAGMYVISPILAAGTTIALLFIPISCCVINHGLFAKKTLKKLLIGVCGLTAGAGVVMLGLGAIPAAAIGSFTSYMVRELTGSSCPKTSDCCWSKYKCQLQV